MSTYISNWRYFIMKEFENGFFSSAYKGLVIQWLAFFGACAAMLKVGYSICTDTKVIKNFTDPSKGITFEVDGVEMAIVPAVKVL